MTFYFEYQYFAAGKAVVISFPYAEMQEKVKGIMCLNYTFCSVLESVFPSTLKNQLQ